MYLVTNFGDLRNVGAQRLIINYKHENITRLVIQLPYWLIGISDIKDMDGYVSRISEHFDSKQSANIAPLRV